MSGFSTPPVGEYAETTVLVGAAVPTTTGTQTTIMNLALSAGDWDVSAILLHKPDTTTSVTRYAASLSLTNNVFDSTPGRFVDFWQPAYVSGGNTFNDVVPPCRFLLPSPATIYLVALNAFTVSTMACYGIVRARRWRF